MVKSWKLLLSPSFLAVLFTTEFPKSLTRSVFSLPLIYGFKQDPNPTSPPNFLDAVVIRFLIAPVIPRFEVDTCLLNLSLFRSMKFMPVPLLVFSFFVSTSFSFGNMCWTSWALRFFEIWSKLFEFWLFIGIGHKTFGETCFIIVVWLFYSFGTCLFIVLGGFL